MAEHGFALFATSIGRCAIVWSERGIVAVRLPERRDSETRARILRRCPHAREALPPPPVQDALERIVALLQGQATDLSSIALDLDGVPDFDREVYGVARGIPCGSTTTYGEIAARLNERGSARDVGVALARNPFAIVVPCHRVLAAGGKAGGFSAMGGLKTKLRLLMIERALPQGIFEAAR
jgi:methylated-DNA-[protein]-cysteine S-methyltransferase